MSEFMGGKARARAGETQATGIEDPILVLLRRLARPHSSGGRVIERAAIMASGGDFTAIEAWIADHDGTPEAVEPSSSRLGLHGKRLTEDTAGAKTLRFVLPPGVL